MELIVNIKCNNEHKTKSNCQPITYRRHNSSTDNNNIKDHEVDCSTVGKKIASDYTLEIERTLSRIGRYNEQYATNFQVKIPKEDQSASLEIVNLHRFEYMVCFMKFIVNINT